MAKKKTERNYVEEFLALPEAEKNRIAREFDKPLAKDEFRAPRASQRRLLEKARRKRGRPRQGQGSKVVSISMELGLLKKADELAQREGISRAQLVARGLRMLIDA